MEKIIKKRRLDTKIISIVLLICACHKKAQVLSTTDLIKGRWQLIASSSVPFYLKDSTSPRDLFPGLPPCPAGYFLTLSSGNTGHLDTSCNVGLKISWSVSTDSLFLIQENPDSLVNSRQINELTQELLKTSRIELPTNDTPVLVFESYIRR